MAPILLGLLGTQEIIVLAIIILILFGGRKIPELMRGLGRGVKEFKDGMNGITNEEETNTKTEKQEEKNK